MKLQLLLSALLGLVLAEELPLSFEFGKDNPLKSRIYLNPALSMVKINELASREVAYVKDNVTRKLEEEVGEWYPLVSDDDNPSPRYALLKQDLCNEKDFRISWVDDKGKTHPSVIQRLGPSPTDWNPTAQIQVTSLKFDPKAITVEFAYTINKDNLENKEKLSNFTPSIQLESCELLFDKPVPFPIVDAERKLITISPAYADHMCVFSLHVSILIYNPESECRDMMQTTNGTSAKIALRCDQANGYECPKIAQQQSCKMTCDPNLIAKADYKYDVGYPEPFVKIDWQQSSSNKLPVKGSFVRYSQVDVIYNNHLLGEFNTTVERVNGTSFDLKPFSKSPEALYSVQVCIVHDANCAKEPKWDAVPRHPIYATSLVQALPPPPTTTRATTTTTEAPTTKAQAVNGTQPKGGKKVSTTEAPAAPAKDDRKQSAIDNMVAVVTTPKAEEATTKSGNGQGDGSGVPKMVPLSLVFILCQSLLYVFQ